MLTPLNQIQSKKMAKSVFTIIVITILFGACKKSPETVANTTITSLPIPVATAVTGSVAGSVVDENNNPVANAQVLISGTVFTTDSKGFFNTSNITLDKYISTVTVTKTGYFKGIRSFSANATKNYVSIKLIPKTLAGTFASSTAGTINLSNNSQISFTANSINVKSTGTAYTGTVNVYASYIDPTSNDIGARVPGSFIGEDATQIYYLQSAGMIAVELESTAGEPLQLATGKPATVKLAIPASVQANATNTIDTWSLNDKGVWIKEGTATKNGAFYEMQVSHFSFWNCDHPTSSVYVTINIKDQNNNNLQNTVVRIKGSWGTAGGVTDSLGNVSGYIPANESLQLDLFSDVYSICNSLYTQTIGPFTTNTNLNVTATIPSQQTLTITGKVNNCAGAPVANGTAIIYSGFGSYFTNVVNGSFTLTIARCSGYPIPLQIIGIDNIAQQQSTAISFTATQNNTDVGTINACATSSNQFINYTIDGTNYVINSSVSGSTFSAYIYGLQTIIKGVESSSKKITIVATGTNVGTYPGRLDSALNAYPYVFSITGSLVTITTLPSVGEFIEGNFTLPFTPPPYGTPGTHTCTGTFRVRRTY